MLTSFFKLTCLALPIFASAVNKRQASCTLSASGKDDAPAFLAAVQSCATTTIPKGVNLTIQSKMDMSTLTSKTIVLNGIITFSPNVAYWTTAGNTFPVAFQKQASFWRLGGTGVTLTGTGTLDGQGETWYAAYHHNNDIVRPIVLHAYNAKNLLVQGITILNSPEWANLVDSSTGVTYNNINISAPLTSPNTDGWDIYRSSGVTIMNSNIVNGDDCVSFKPNSTNISVYNLNCTGSHGISVGSLGQYSGIYDIVQNVVANKVTLNSCTNGARIKAWAGPNVGSGLVQNITFENFVVNDTEKPLIIDQCYETSASDCASNPSNVRIQDIYFAGFTGTSNGATVADLACSPGAQCSDINVNNIAVSSGSKKPKYECANTSVLGNDASLFTCTTG